MSATIPIRVAVVCVVLSGLAESAILRVPEDYPSVLEATDAATAGDSVLVQPGDWGHTDVRVAPSGTSVKSPLFTKPGVTVLAVEGPGTTTLNAGEQVDHVAVTVANYQPGAEAARVIGFTITGGGQGVSSDTAAPLELHDCEIVDNSGRAIGFADATIRMVGGLISGNGGNQYGTIGGLCGVELELTNVAIEQNGSAFGVVLPCAGAPVRLTGCTFRDQLLALRINDCPDLVIEDCLFERCSLGAIQSNDSSGEVRFNTFAYDSAVGGAGMLLSRCELQIENNTFYRCHAEQGGAGIALSFTDAGVQNNIFAHCSGPGGAVRFGGGVQHPDTGCNLFWQNESDYGSDWLPAPTDLEADPQFCNEPTLDLTLHSTSPAAPAHNSCGLLGAWDVQCGPVSVTPTSWGRLKNLYREVQP